MRSIVGTRLASAADPPVSGLTPRQRDALVRLLTGESEKEAAARMGVTGHTFHQYAKAVYRHYRVRSRPELMAYFLARGGASAVAPA